MMSVDEIIEIAARGRAAHVPPLSDYALVSALWTEAEYHCLETPAASARVGFWTGEPGFVALNPWPYTEICTVLSGRVAVCDLAGGRREFGPSQSFVVPKGFVGTWETIERASKVFVAIW